MAYKRISPVPVAEGGTGATTLTNGGVLVGSGTAAIDALAVGTTGQLLVGATGSDPAFASSASADFTFTSATASTTRTLTISNTDNTGAATSAAKVQVTVGGANVGDPTTSYTVTGATTFTLGIDNSASDSYKIAASTALGTTDVMVATTAGEVTMPLQPAFSAYLSANANNVTGNGTVYTVICDTEVFDINSDYNNATGVFTAPVTGKYVLAGVVHFISADTGGNEATARLVTSNRTYFGSNYPTKIRVANFFGVNNAIAYRILHIADMDAGDTATLAIQSNNGSLVDDIYGTSPDVYTAFNGYLAC